MMLWVWLGDIYVWHKILNMLNTVQEYFKQMLTEKELAQNLPELAGINSLISVDTEASRRV